VAIKVSAPTLFALLHLICSRHKSEGYSSACDKLKLVPNPVTAVEKEAKVEAGFV
jgi:hypothetical protein